MLSFSSASNIKTGSKSINISNGSLIFDIDGNSQRYITSNEARLTIAIADHIISEGLSFNIFQKPGFKKVPRLSRDISKTYIPPNRNLVSKELLDVLHEQNMERYVAMIRN